MEKLIHLLIALVGIYLARQIDRRSLMVYLERAHTGASVEWARSLRETHGRHARRDVTYA